MCTVRKIAKAHKITYNPCLNNKVKFYKYGKAQPTIKYKLLCYSKDVLSLHPSKKVVERLASRRKSNGMVILQLHRNHKILYLNRSSKNSCFASSEGH